MGSKALHFLVKDQHCAVICYTWRTGDSSLCSPANMGKNQVTKALTATLKGFHKWHAWLLPEESWQR